MVRIRIQIRWIRKILASWIRIRKNMWIHKLRENLYYGDSYGVLLKAFTLKTPDLRGKISTKNCKNY